MKKFVLFVFFIICSFSNAQAITAINGAKVTLVEGTYMPDLVSFQLDVGSTTCPAGTNMVWQKTVENNKAIYTLLITALTGGRKINFYINDGDASCKGQFIHLTNG